MLKATEIGVYDPNGANSDNNCNYLAAKCVAWFSRHCNVGSKLVLNPQVHKAPMSFPTIARFIAVLLCAFHGDLGAEDENYFLLKSPVTEHLPQDTPLSTFVDSKGFLWIRTAGGLHRYDGYRLKTIQKKENTPRRKAGLYGSAKDLLFEGATGDIWYLSIESSLYRYTPASRAFKPANRLLKEHLEDMRGIRTVFLDDNKRMWISMRAPSGEKVLWMNTVNLVTDTLTSLSHYISSDDFITDFFKSSDGAIFLLSRKGQLLNCLTEQETCLEIPIRDLVEHQTPISMSRIAAISKSAIYISTVEDGLLTILHKSLEPIRAHREIFEGDLSAISAVLPTNGDTFWIGSSKGVFLVKNGNLTHRLNSQNSALANDDVLSISAGPDENLLIGNVDGLYILRRSFFKSYEKSSGLANTATSSFNEARDGKIYVGTSDGIYTLDPLMDKIAPLNLPGGAKLKGSWATVIHSDEDNLWIGYFADGLQRLPKIGAEADVPEDMSVSQTTISCIERLPDSSTAVCTINGGVKFYASNGSLLASMQPYDNSPNDLLPSIPLAIESLGNGSLVIGGESGITMLSKSSTVTTDYVLNKRFSGIDVTALQLDSNGNLWVGTLSSGILIWKDAKIDDDPSFLTLTTDPPLPDYTIHGILEDELGYIWVSTNNGLVRINPNTYRIDIYDTSDGLPDEEFNFGAAFKDSHGNLYFGGNHGFVRFDPTDFVTTRKPPPLRLTEIMVSNEPVSYDPAYLPPERLELDHNDHSVDFEFSTMDIISPGRSVYKYMLQGFDEDWIDIGRRNTATFTSLPAGDYLFRVIGANSDGVWNYDGISLPIRVLPAPWLTWWAFALYGTAALALLLLIKRHYDTHVLKEEATRQAKAMTATATHAMDELQDQLKVEQRLVGNLRRHAAATMDTISELLAMESEEIDDPLALDTMQRTRQRLQCLRALESGVYFHVDVLKVNFRDAVDSAFAGVMEGAPPLHCEIVLANECTDTLVPIDIAMPLVVLTHELLLNSVVHAFEGCEGIECITVRLEEHLATGGWILEVADTGPGLPTSIDPMAPTTLGMELINRVVHKLDAKLTYSGERGARFRVEVPG